MELDGQGNILAVNTFGPTGLLSRHSATGSTFYTFDAQGSVAQRLDSNGNVLTTSIYDSFGNKVSMEPQSDPWGYNAQSGYYTDAETGLILCTHRYYDSTQGRWLNRDPIGYAGGINLYGYVGNGVVGGVDPSGYGPIVPATPEFPGLPNSNSVLQLTAGVGGSCVAPNAAGWFDGNIVFQLPSVGDMAHGNMDNLDVGYVADEGTTMVAGGWGRSLSAEVGAGYGSPLTTGNSKCSTMGGFAAVPDGLQLGGAVSTSSDGISASSGLRGGIGQGGGTWGGDQNNRGGSFRSWAANCFQKVFQPLYDAVHSGTYGGQHLF